MLRGKNIDLNHFKNDVLSDAIEEYQVYFEDTRGGKGELSKTKEFSHERMNGRTAFTTTSNHRKNCCLPLSYVIRKDPPIYNYGKNRHVHIIHQASLVGNMFTRDSGKVIDIIKEMALGTNSEHVLSDSSVA